jgi:hypothetical protein
VKKKTKAADIIKKSKSRILPACKKKGIRNKQCRTPRITYTQSKTEYISISATKKNYGRQSSTWRVKTVVCLQKPFPPNTTLNDPHERFSMKPTNHDSLASHAHLTTAASAEASATTPPLLV